ncbi:hypothetical protein THASP1DRAFT_35467 [Thamnocephalis sphaerospora]|uniref:Cullin family profile domain-containing protein n=1 Tax=Thamnocephalis sphaerospora TaxID=78915 RepID=A0A4V1IVP2_9FUNG|nr:hypothetical protein THASP1DRAFT_35467 [Thamnocephalis sphaerospora]|eukprot:RKP04749.1 hypothetical protein THASP1DRAFT_35467 [Thamnocephalis sphaerospora]
MQKAIYGHILALGRELNRTMLEDKSEKPAEEASADKKSGKRVAVRERNANLALRWMEVVLPMQTKFERILREGLNGDKAFQVSINEAFATFINENNRSAELISLFIDENLQRGIKGKSELEVDAVLDEAVSLFRYVDDKDIFERYYKQHLSRRLLQSKSASDDAERSMIAKLKVECGCQFTSKLEGMFNDIKLSSDLMQQYRNISVQVLTSTYWPIAQQTTTCHLPQVLHAAQERFTSFYLSRYSGRKLMFHLNMGTVEVRVQFNEKRHDLIVPTYTMAVLMQFGQTDDWITYEALLETTGIAEEDLQRNLYALTCAKHPILRKDPPHKEEPVARSGHRFAFNSSFKSKLVRIRIAQAAPRLEKTEERKATMERVTEERQIQTDACIVRIMKSRRQMEHNTLVAEVTQQLLSRFRPDPANIKRRIESLIEREYLERTKDNIKRYQYLA